jgi:hypothetical protein
VLLVPDVAAVAALVPLVLLVPDSICCSVAVMSWNRLPPVGAAALLDPNRFMLVAPFALLLPSPDKLFWLAIWLSQLELPQILLIDIVRSLEKLSDIRATGKALPPQTPAPANRCRMRGALEAGRG